jgi:riboflavin biosynthesis pyrimidine reductase
MSELAPFELLYTAASGPALPLPSELEHLYGALNLPQVTGRPTVIGNFVTTLDGVVSLNIPGQAGGGPISGSNRHDRLVMGILRAAADAVVVGAGTLRAVPQHRWTAAYVYPDLAAVYGVFRRSLGKTTPPLTVLVTASGRLDLSLPVFQSGEAPVLIVTSDRGATVLAGAVLPTGVEVASVGNTAHVGVKDMLQAIERRHPLQLVLSEGGPQLIGDFLAERCLDELFLTLAPQIAGRKDGDGRPGLVAGHHFAPTAALWGQLIDVRRAGSHLFLRYGFEADSTQN